MNRRSVAREPSNGVAGVDESISRTLVYSSMSLGEIKVVFDNGDAADDGLKGGGEVAAGAGLRYAVWKM